MNLSFQALPLLMIIVLLASGRVNAAPACLIALVCALPAIWLAAPGDVPGFLLRETGRGLWLAAPPMAIVAGGLLFHAAVERPAGAVAGSPGEQMFTASFLLGPFAESVTGFGVGSIFAIGAVRRAGGEGAPAAAIGLLALSLIPWGGLGPGSALGAALANIPARDMMVQVAPQSAVFLLCLLPLFWRLAGLAGHPVPPRRRVVQFGWVAATAVLLVLWSRLLPWEVAGMLATGPLLVVRLLLAAPPRGVAAWRSAIAAAAPYGLLVAALLAARLWPDAPAWHAYADLPPMPLNHVAVVLWLVAGGLLLHRTKSPGPALWRARRPALAILLFVLLSRFLAAAGVPAALAGAMAGALGPAAHYGAPLLALVSGFVGGSNVGSNAMLMPFQATLGQLAGLPATLLPAVQNFAGAQASMFSPQVTAVFGGLTGARPGAIWRLAWPVFPLIVAIGLATVALG
jgi:lactate permease